MSALRGIGPGMVAIPELWQKMRRQKKPLVPATIWSIVPNSGKVTVKTQSGKIATVHDPEIASSEYVGRTVLVGQSAEDFIVKTLPKLVPTRSKVVVLP